MAWDPKKKKLTDIRLVLPDKEIARLKKSLSKLRPASQRKVLRPAITKGCRAIKRVMKQKAGDIKDTGALQKSIGFVVKTYPRKNTVQGWSGPRSDYQPGGPGKRKPALYAHLVEFGTVHSHKTPFVRPTIDQAMPEVTAILVREVRANMKKELLRLKAKRR